MILTVPPMQGRPSTQRWVSLFAKISFRFEKVPKIAPGTILDKFEVFLPLYFRSSLYSFYFRSSFYYWPTPQFESTCMKFVSSPKVNTSLENKLVLEFIWNKLVLAGTISKEFTTNQFQKSSGFFYLFYYRSNFYLQRRPCPYWII